MRKMYSWPRASKLASGLNLLESATGPIAQAFPPTATPQSMAASHGQWLGPKLQLAIGVQCHGLEWVTRTVSRVALQAWM